MKTRKGLPAGRQGFTIIESVIGIAIFLILALGVFEAYRALYLSMAATEDRMQALSIASSKLEEALGQPYESLSSAAGTIERNGRSFDFATTVEALDDPAGHKLVEVEVACADCRNFEPIIVVGRIADI